MRPIVCALVAAAALAGMAADSREGSGQAEGEAASVFGLKIPPGTASGSDLGGARGRQAQRPARHPGQRHRVQGRPRRPAFLPGRQLHRADRLELRPLPESDKAFGRAQSFVAGKPKNGVQFMVKGSAKFGETSGWGFAQFDDGKPVSDVVHNACFACHAIVQARDLVFNGHAP
jgi:Cytochrome P460